MKSTKSLFLDLLDPGEPVKTEQTIRVMLTLQGRCLEVEMLQG